MRDFSTPQPNTPKILHNETYMLILRISPPEHQAPLLVNWMIYQYNLKLNNFRNIIQTHSSVLWDWQYYVKYSSHLAWMWKYFEKHCQSYKTLLWVWKMLCWCFGRPLSIYNKKNNDFLQPNNNMCIPCLMWRFLTPSTVDITFEFWTMATKSKVHYWCMWTRCATNKGISPSYPTVLRCTWAITRMRCMHALMWLVNVDKCISPPNGQMTWQIPSCFKGEEGSFFMLTLVLIFPIRLKRHVTSLWQTTW